MTSLFVAALLAQKLDTTQVRLTERRGVFPPGARNSREIKGIDRAALSETDTADLARLTQRFIARARRHGLTVEEPSEDRPPFRADGGPNERRLAEIFSREPPELDLEHPVLAAIRKRSETTTTWILTANNLVTPFCEGNCPCDETACECAVRNRTLPECVRHLSSIGLVVTFTIEGRRLVREDALVQTFQEPVAPRPRPAPVDIQVKGTAVARLRAALNDSRTKLAQCFNEEVRTQVRLSATWEPVGSKAVVGRLAQLSPLSACRVGSATWPSCACLMDELRELKPDAPATSTPVTLQFSSGR